MVKGKSTQIPYLEIGGFKSKNLKFLFINIQSNLAIVNWSIVNNGSIVNFFWLLFNQFIT